MKTQSVSRLELCAALLGYISLLSSPLIKRQLLLKNPSHSIATIRTA